MDYTTSHGPLFRVHFGESLVVRLYSEINQIHLSSEAQCASHHLPQVDCHSLHLRVIVRVSRASNLFTNPPENFLRQKHGNFSLYVQKYTLGYQKFWHLLGVQDKIGQLNVPWPLVSEDLIMLILLLWCSEPTFGAEISVNHVIHCSTTQFDVTSSMHFL